MRLVLLNGPAAIGKSTLARRYVDGHPNTVALDVDEIRAGLASWPEDPVAAGLAARAVVLDVAREHLLAGRDVLVPQLVARPAFLEQLEALAEDVGAAFVEVVLMDTRDGALARCEARDGVVDDEVLELYDLLVALLPSRPSAVVVPSTYGDEDGTYERVCAALS